MGGSNKSWLPYVTGPLQMAGGAVATYFGAPEIGIPLIAGGVGQLGGKAAGGTGNIGEMIGLGAGTAGEGFAGLGPLGSALGGGSIQGALSGTGIGNALGVQPTALQALSGPAASTPEQISNLAQAGFPGAEQMQAAGQGTLPGGFPVTGASAAANAPPSGGGLGSFLQGAGNVSNIANAANNLSPKPEPPPSPPQPGFKTALAESPTAPRGPTPVTPSVTQVPKAPEPPSLQELAYQKYLAKLNEPPWFIGGTG